MDEIQAKAESHTAEAINASAVAQEAIEKARSAQFMAVLEEFFNRGLKEKKFVDIGRIPFICDDIRGIHGTLSEIQTNIVWIKWVVMGAAGGVGAILVGILISLVTKFL